MEEVRARPLQSPAPALDSEEAARHKMGDIPGFLSKEKLFPNPGGCKMENPKIFYKTLGLRDRHVACFQSSNSWVLFFLFSFTPQSGKKRNQHPLKTYCVPRPFHMLAPLTEGALLDPKEETVRTRGRRGPGCALESNCTFPEGNTESGFQTLPSCKQSRFGGPGSTARAAKYVQNG